MILLVHWWFIGTQTMILLVVHWNPTDDSVGTLEPEVHCQWFCGYIGTSLSPFPCTQLPYRGDLLECALFPSTTQTAVYVVGLLLSCDWPANTCSVTKYMPPLVLFICICRTWLSCTQCTMTPWSISWRSSLRWRSQSVRTPLGYTAGFSWDKRVSKSFFSWQRSVFPLFIEADNFFHGLLLIRMWVWTRTHIWIWDKFLKIFSQHLRTTWRR